MTNIVMLTRDRFRLTEQAFASLYAHTDHDQFTLTIVDDESEDFRTLHMIDTLGKRNATVLRIRHSKHILGMAKNLGVYWSGKYFGRGEWLYLSDNDAYFCEGWLEKLLVVAHSSEGTGFRIWGGQAHPFHKELGGMMFGNFVDDEQKQLRREIRWTEHDCLAGTSWLMRWETWDRFGPLDANAVGPCQGEDWAFTERLRAAGGRIGVVQPHVVLDCGISQTDGKPSPGADIKERVSGVYYE